MYSYSTNPSLNVAIGGVSLAEGWAANLVNDSERAFVAEICKWRDDLSGVPVSSGTNTITVSLASTLSTLTDGNLFAFKAGSTCAAGATTLQVGATAAKSLKVVAIGGPRDPLAGEITQHGRYFASLDLANDRYLLLNPSVGGAGASFRAHKNATQSLTNNVAAKLLFQTEDYDTGGHFTNSAWTPPAGTALVIGAYFIASAFGSANPLQALVYVDGSPITRGYDRGTTSDQAGVMSLVPTTGTTTIELWGLQQSGATQTVDDNAELTYFMGVML